MARFTTRTKSVNGAVFLVSLLLLCSVCGRTQGAAPTPPQDANPVTHYPGDAPAPAPAPQNRQTQKTGSTAAAGDLNRVLEEMDEASVRFKAAQADIELVQYTAVVKEKDVQSGHIFFRRKGRETEVSLWIEKPHPKQAVVRDDKVTFFDPRTKQVTERALGDNKQDVEAVMNLGFGGRGKDLLAEYDVNLVGWETVDGVNTARLELVAKSERLRRLFSKLVLWMDPKRDVALQQQRFELSGDYQLTHYTNIKMPASISDDKFVIKK
jgi:outer membrane lipoprotein-sorting protein